MSRTDTAPQDSGSPSVPVKLAAAGAGVASSSRVADDRAFRADREVRRSSLPKISAEAWVQITLGAIVTALLVFVSSLPKRGPAREDPSRVAAALGLPGHSP